MSIKRWPFPGDSPIARARKVGLAYRAALQQRQQANEQITALLKGIDRRLVNFDNPEAGTLIDKALAALAGDDVSDLDKRFSDWGETWHCEQPENWGPDDWVKGVDAAKILHVSSKTVQTMRMRGRIKGIWEPGPGNTGAFWYKVSDVYQLVDHLRGKNWRGKGSTDTLNNSGRSDTK